MLLEENLQATYKYVTQSQVSLQKKLQAICHTLPNDTR